ncbi:AbrB/MazE/SpoVT family DNA-binding domain-containing protein [Serratia quinivorans]|uniref:AbrB/MazE/SpoVT family DNA-binding domain-containing protein n=1 Tax=Serratia quinivorans TaxID=137545 RepID=A0ABV3UQ94_9GAMM
MTTAISKWGNGAGLRIPQPFMRQLGLTIGDEIKFKVTSTELIITKSGPSLDELLEKCSPENRHAEIFCDSQGKEML